MHEEVEYVQCRPTHRLETLILWPISFVFIQSRAATCVISYPEFLLIEFKNEPIFFVKVFFLRVHRHSFDKYIQPSPTKSAKICVIIKPLCGWKASCPPTYVCVCGHHFQQTGYQTDMVVNPARGQLNRKIKNLCPSLRLRVLVWRVKFGCSVPPSARSFSSPRLNLVLTYGIQPHLTAFRYGFH